MKRIARLILPSLLALPAAPVLHAQSALGILACQSSQGSTITLPTSYFDVTVNVAPAPNLLVVEADIATFPTLVTQVQSKATYASCTLTSGGIVETFSNVAIQGVDAFGEAINTTIVDYVTSSSASFTFGSLSISGVPTPAVKSNKK